MVCLWLLCLFLRATYNSHKRKMISSRFLILCTTFTCSTVFHPHTDDDDDGGSCLAQGDSELRRDIAPLQGPTLIRHLTFELHQLRLL